MRNNGIFSPSELYALRDSDNLLIMALYAEVLEAARAAKNTGHDMTELAFGYYVTGDIAYFDRARALMLETANEEQWYSEEYDPNAYEGYDIRTALETHSRCVRMSYGLTLFGDLLEPDEFAFLVRTTMEKGIYPILFDWVLPGHRIHALDTMGHNFWVITISGAATALSLLHDCLPDYEGLTPKDMLDAAIDAIRAWFDYAGNPLNAKPKTIDCGGYYESVTYFDFALHEYLVFADAHMRVFGKKPFDDTEILMKAADFFINVSYPSSKRDMFVPFGDSGDNACGFLYAPMYMLRYGLDHPGLRRFEQSVCDQDTEKLLRLLAWDNIYQKEAAASVPLSACYDGIGWAMFKSSDARDCDMLCIKCGDTWNHAHADAGHFTLFRHGDSEIHDSNTTSYSSPNYISYFTDSHAHNVLLFEGKGQDFRDNYKNHAHLPGKLYNYRDEDDFRYVVADATGPESRWFRKHHRHFLWLDGFVLIYDDVECYETGTVNYLLHTENSSCHRMLTFCDVTVQNGFTKRTPDLSEAECTYLSFNRPTDTEGHVRFAALLLLDGTLTYTFEENTPDWTLQIGDYTVYFNHRADGKVAHRNGIVIMGGYITDALLLITKNGIPHSVVNGSIVRPADGTKSALESLYRVTGRI